MKPYNKIKDTYESIKEVFSSPIRNLEKSISIGVIIPMILSGCAATSGQIVQNSIPAQQKGIDVECRHSSIACGLMYREHYGEVRIARGKSKRDANIPHAQARVKVNGEWKYIQVRRDFLECRLGDRELTEEELAILKSF